MMKPNHYPVGTILIEKQKQRRKWGVVVALREEGKHHIYHVKWMLEDKYYGQFEYFKNELEAHFTIIGYND